MPVGSLIVAYKDTIDAYNNQNKKIVNPSPAIFKAPAKGPIILHTSKMFINRGDLGLYAAVNDKKIGF